jgi:hypothetical protein
MGEVMGSVPIIMGHMLVMYAFIAVCFFLHTYDIKSCIMFNSFCETTECIIRWETSRTSVNKKGKGDILKTKWMTLKQTVQTKLLETSVEAQINVRKA